eukprot:gene26463-biopygen16566
MAAPAGLAFLTLGILFSYAALGRDGVKCTPWLHKADVVLNSCGTFDLRRAPVKCTQRLPNVALQSNVRNVTQLYVLK